MSTQTYGPVADFGPLTLGTDVDELILDTLRKWMPTYMAELQRERPSIVTMQPVKSYVSTIEEEEFPEHWLPAIVVTTAATTGDPEKDGDGNYYAAWTVAVSAIVRGRDSKETRHLASQFEGCVRRAIVQQGVDADGEVRWDSCVVRPVRDPSNAGRYIAAGMSTFTVFLDRVVSEGGPLDDDQGPYIPPDTTDPDTPYQPPATVETVLVDVNGKSPNQTIGS